MKRISNIFALLALVAAVIGIAGHGSNLAWVVYIFKPLATLLVVCIALANWISRKQNYALWIGLGLAFSLVGDILLMWPERYFVAGLAAFLFTHVAYLVAFTRGVKFPASWATWIVYLAIGAAAYFVLSPQLPAQLKLPVASYAFALATMAAQAMGRYILLRTRVAMIAAAGGIFFMVSDGLLAADRFRSAIPYAAIVVLAPYYIAQVLIALSTQAVEKSQRCRGW